MPNESTGSIPSILPWSGRRARFWGIGLLVGIVLLASVYLWSTRESPSAHPVNVVTVWPPIHPSSSGVEVVPVQYEFEFKLPPCPTTDTGQLCLIIGTGNVTPASANFT